MVSTLAMEAKIKKPIAAIIIPRATVYLVPRKLATRADKKEAIKVMTAIGSMRTPASKGV